MKLLAVEKNLKYLILIKKFQRDSKNMKHMITSNTQLADYPRIITRRKIKQQIKVFNLLL